MKIIKAAGVILLIVASVWLLAMLLLQALRIRHVAGEPTAVLCQIVGEQRPFDLAYNTSPDVATVERPYISLTVPGGALDGADYVIELEPCWTGVLTERPFLAGAEPAYICEYSDQHGRARLGEPTGETGVAAAGNRGQTSEYFTMEYEGIEYYITAGEPGCYHGFVSLEEQIK